MIQCRLSNSQSEPSKLETNTNGTQQKPYIGGAGWKKTRYNYFLVGNIRNLKETLDAGRSGTEGVMLELRKGSHNDPSSFVERSVGYFKAPADGNYIFSAFAAEKFALYINPLYGSAEIDEDTEPLIWSNRATGNTSHFNTLGDQIISEGVSLEKDQYYYMELYQSKSYSSYFSRYADYL